MRLPGIPAFAMDAIERLPARWTNRTGLDVAWQRTWTPALDAALAVLPETPACPHELFRDLMRNPTAVGKRTALVTDGGTPVAVVGLRQRKRHWEPVTQDIAPFSLFPALPGYEFAALRATGLNLWIADWDGPLPPADMTSIAFANRSHRLDLHSDFERFWRETGIHKDIRAARNRTKSFVLEVDAPDAAAWTIIRCAEKWRDQPNAPADGVEDQLLAAEFYAGRGMLHALRLLDGDRPVAGANYIVHGRDLIEHVIYHEPDYRWHGAGNRLHDLTFAWARDAGYDAVDIGSGAAYKERWAPPAGEQWTFNICPPHLDLARRTLRSLRTRPPHRRFGRASA